MEKDKYDSYDSIVLDQEKREIKAQFRIYENDDDTIGVILEFGNSTLAASGNNAFRALDEIRKQLESRNMLVCCLGSAEDVYPSTMSMQMGIGDKAYRTRVSQKANLTDLVCIFDLDTSLNPVTIEKQESFHENWINSIKS